jgi:hypothetical protein
VSQQGRLISTKPEPLSRRYANRTSKFSPTQCDLFYHAGHLGRGGFVRRQYDAGRRDRVQPGSGDPKHRFQAALLQ